MHKSVLPVVAFALPMLFIGAGEHVAAVAARSAHGAHRLFMRPWYLNSMLCTITLVTVYCSFGLQGWPLKLGQGDLVDPASLHCLSLSCLYTLVGRRLL